MPCTCQGKPKSESKSLVQDALWALAFAGTRRDARALPPPLRSMTPDEALAILRPVDPGGIKYGWAALHMMFIAAGLLWRHHRELKVLNDIRIVPSQVVDFLPIFAWVFQASELVAKQFLSALRASALAGLPPCGGQSGTGTYNSTLNATSLESRIIVYRPLGQVARFLDPRAWDECSELFLRTCRVSDAPECEPRCLSPTADYPPGADWDGIIYEHAGAGPQEVENLLSVDFDISKNTKGVRKVEVEYSLYRSISHRLGGWESAGLFRRNAGKLTAKPIKYDIPEGPANADCTELVVTKDVEFGRLSSWRGSALVDYGDLCDYLAPALLTLWVTNLALIVPCCGK